MDNVTHALIGVCLARLALPWVRSLRGALWVSVLASNLPDVDWACTPFFEDPRLGYLVHHRGYTHTFVVATGLAVALALGVQRWIPAARRAPMIGLAVVAAWLHVGADAWNNYGVHPFWPFDNHWFYGDFIFIVEPWLWTALIPAAWHICGPRTRVGLGALVLAMAGALGWLQPWLGVTWMVATALILRVLGNRGGLGAPTALVILTLVAFGWASRVVRVGYERRVPGALVDVILTPHPALPWCWQALTVSTGDGRVHVRTAHTSLLPAWTPAEACALRVVSRTAPMVPADLPDDPTTTWGPRFEGELGELATLASERCRVDTLLRFTRAPYWTDHVAGDLRYDAEPGLGFAEIPTAGSEGCMQAPWTGFYSGPVPAR